MYANKGNTAAKPRRRTHLSPERIALHIAESIAQRRAEGRPYTVEEYGLGDKPELVVHVARALGVIR